MIVTNPGEIRTFTHKADMRRMQRSLAFKKMKQDHALVPGAICAHCGRFHKEVRMNWRTQAEHLDKNGHIQITHLTINHKYQWLSLSPELYLTWDPVTMEVCCTVCNGWYRKGKEPCPVCGINPILKDDPNGKGMCDACYLALHPEVKEQREQRKEALNLSRKQYNKQQAAKRRAIRSRHPCRYHGKEQRCRRGGTCRYSKKKALAECQMAVARKGVEA